MATHDFAIGIISGGAAGLTGDRGAIRLGARTTLIDKARICAAIAISFRCPRFCGMMGHTQRVVMHCIASRRSCRPQEEK